MSGTAKSIFAARTALHDAVLRAVRASPLLWLSIVLWLVVLALAVLVVPGQYALRAQDRNALQQAQSAQVRQALAAQKSSAEGLVQPLSQSESSQRNAAQFKSLLTQAPLPEGAQKTLFTLAKRWELELPQGQYKLACDASGAWCSYRMQLPVVGSYSAVRGFVQDALHALPSLALESAAFKREVAATDELEVALRWTLYQAPVRAAGDAP